MAEQQVINNNAPVHGDVESEKPDDRSSGVDTRLDNPAANESISDEDRAFFEKYGTYDRYEITEEDCYDELGFSFPNWKKWMILSVVFIVQVSMNFNTSLYSNAVSGISEEFHVSAQSARLGAALFLIFYAFGCELWAPWSEELGRWPILQLSLLFVNIWQIPVGIAPNFGTVLAFRCLGGLSTAGGSVTLGMVADMWEADTQQYAVVCYSCPLSVNLANPALSRRSSCSHQSEAQCSAPSLEGSSRNSVLGGGTSGFSSSSAVQSRSCISSWYRRLARRS
jgi:hypothetical protein